MFIEHLLCVPGIGDTEVNICSSNRNEPIANRKMIQGSKNKQIDRQTNKETFWIMRRKLMEDREKLV